MTAKWETIVQIAKQGEPLAALDRLQPLIRDVDPSLRYDGLETMIRIALMVYARGDGEEVAQCYGKIFRPFASSVGDPDENVRALALEGISSVLKRGDHETGDLVAPHLKDWRGGVRRTAVDALARLFTGGLAKDNVLTKLVACVEDQDIEVRNSTVRTLLAICPEGNQAAISALITKVKNSPRDVQALASEVLGVVAKPGDVKVIKGFALILQTSDDARVRRNAAIGLGKMGLQSNDPSKPNKYAEVCVEALCAALGCTLDLPIVDLQWIADEPARRLAEEEAQRAWSASQNPAEQKEVDSEAEVYDSRAEANASDADVDPGPVQVSQPEQSPESAEPGTDQVADEDQMPSTETDDAVPRVDIRAFPLGELYPHLGFDLLGEIQKDSDASVRYEALCSLQKIVDRGDRRVLGALLVALRDPDREVCCRAVDAISSLYDFVPGDLTLVIAVAQMLMQDSTGYGNINNRKAALQALLRASEVGDEAMVAVLVRHLEAMRDLGLDAGAGERKLLLEALQCIVPEEWRSELEDALVASLEDPTAEVRIAALKLLSSLNPEPVRVRAITKRLRDRHPEVKALAAEVLCTWGEEPLGITRAFRQGGNEYRLGE